MNTIDRYVEDVMKRIAPGIPDRDRIETDLRMHLAERIEAEGDEARALERMGSPEDVARSFLAEIDPPLAEPSERLGAFLLDVGLLVASLGLAGLLVAVILGHFSGAGAQSASMVEAVAIFLVATLFIAPALLYFPVLEAWYGQTPGKRVFEIYVARESGERAGLGATVVRRLPLLFEVWPFDALFVFFTEKRQRAIEVVAKTIVIGGDGRSGRRAAWGWVLAPWLVVAAIAGLLVALT